MRVVFEFEQFDNIQVNNLMTEILLGLKKDLIKHLNLSNFESKKGLLVILFNPPPNKIALQQYGTPKELQKKIGDLLDSFDWCNTLEKIKNIDLN